MLAAKVTADLRDDAELLCIAVREAGAMAAGLLDKTVRNWAKPDGSVVTSRYLIAATGFLSQPKLPAIPGLETFAGKVMHTARWDHNHDMTSSRVAVIGTGASAVQVVPEIAPLVRVLNPPA